MKTTIIHVIDSLCLGGAEKLLVKTINYIDKERYNNIVVILHGPDTLATEIANTPVYRLNFHYKNPLSWIKAIWKLRRLVKEHNASLIHSHLVYSTLVSRLAVLFSDTRLVSTYHCPEYSKLNPYYNRKQHILDFITYKKKHISIFVSETVAKNIRQKLAISENYYIIPNFVPDEFFKKKELHEGGMYHIACVGNLKAEKNYKLALMAMTLLEDNNYHLHIAGEGKERGNLESIILLNGLQSKVTLHGVVNNIWSFLNDKDLFLMTSTSEGMAISLIEAMAAGIPCLVSDIESLRETGKTGVAYFNVNNYKELADKITQMHTDKELNSMLIRRSESIVKEYTSINYLDKLYRIYDGRN